jgi:hypothetical protein
MVFEWNAAGKHCELEICLDIHCDAGVAIVNKVGDFSGLEPTGISNILSLSNVKAKYCVTFDSFEGNQYIVHKGCSSKQVFEQLIAVCILQI